MMKTTTETNIQGLTESEVMESRALHGENVLSPPHRRSMWQLYLEKYKDPIIIILLVAAVISLAMGCFTGEFVETIGIILAVFFATTVGFYFERDATRRFDVLTSMGEEQMVKVVRDGRVTECARREVVVGDIVVLETGDEVPADGTIIEATSLELDESSLTGEPLTEKSEGPLYRSSMVMSGTARMVVTAVGDATEIGKVAREASEISGVKTPLNIQLSHLATLISKVGSAIAIVAFLGFAVHDILTDAAFWHNGDYLAIGTRVLRYFMMAVTLIVMAVPEGLPMAVTLALALNMRRMLRSNILVRRLHASETMGAVTVICTDKTGTLTQNRMTVAHFHGSREMLNEAIALNSTAELDGDKGIGNPTEAALLRWMDGDYSELRQQTEIIDRQPFSTETKYMTTTCRIDGKDYLFMKGAPEIVMAHCEMSDEERKEAEQQLADYQDHAMRTLAFAYTILHPLGSATSLDEGPNHLHLQGIVAIADPVRPDVPKAIADCRRAGIDVRIVTGDNERTAREIARQIGLPDANIMARALPTDKQQLVKRLQDEGQVVAVTGDGTNDAPALNHAHVGLSLGSGTSVAKEASDITLLDDSFHSVVRAVEWGRSLYKNIQRFIFFQLVVNVTALLLVLGGAAIGTEMPLTVTQILWVNLIMDTFAAMALASLPPSHEVLDEKPRRQTDSIITKPMARGIAVIGTIFFIITFAYLWILENNGTEKGVDTVELTRFFTFFVMLQWWNLFNARAFGSRHSAFHHLHWCRGFLIVLALILVGQWMIVEVGGEMFRTVPLSLHDWLVIIAATSPVLIVGELWRLINKLKR